MEAATLDNANTASNNPFANANAPDNILMPQKDNFMLNLRSCDPFAVHHQNGTGDKKGHLDEEDDFLNLHPKLATNGKRLAEEFDTDDDDLGPETDVDAVDDVLLSPTTSTQPSVADVDMFDPFSNISKHDEKASVELDTEHEKAPRSPERHSEREEESREEQRALQQEFAEFESARVPSPREETPTPPVDSVHDVSGLLDNVAESGEDSDDEWNYIEGDKAAQKENINPLLSDQETSNKENVSSDDAMSQLNPDAEEFIPVSSPTIRQISSYMDDPVITQSPRRAIIEDDMKVPSINEFTQEIKKRPSEVYATNGNSTDENASEESGAKGKMTSQEIMEKLLNGRSIDEIEFQPVNSPTKQAGGLDLVFQGGTPQVGDLSDAYSTRAVFGDESTSYLNDTKNLDVSSDSVGVYPLEQQQDPMSASFYQEDFNDDTPFDLNKVHKLPENLEEFLISENAHSNAAECEKQDVEKQDLTVEKMNDINTDLSDNVYIEAEIIAALRPEQLSKQCTDAVQDLLTLSEQPSSNLFVQTSHSPIPLVSDSEILKSPVETEYSSNPFDAPQSPSLADIQQPSVNPFETSRSPALDEVPQVPIPIEEPVSPIPQEETLLSPIPPVEASLSPVPPVEASGSPILPVEELPVVSPVVSAELSVSPVPQGETLVSSASPVEAPLSPVHMVEMLSSPVPLVEAPISPVPPVEACVSPVSSIKAPSSPTPPVEVALSPIPQVEALASPVPPIEASASPVETSASPIPPVEASVSPIPSIEASASPVPLIEASASPVPLVEASASPVPPVEASASPVPQVEAPMSQHTLVEETPFSLIPIDNMSSTFVDLSTTSLKLQENLVEPPDVSPLGLAEPSNQEEPSSQVPPVLSPKLQIGLGEIIEQTANEKSEDVLSPILVSDIIVAEFHNGKEESQSIIKESHLYLESPGEDVTLSVKDSPVSDVPFVESSFDNAKKEGEDLLKYAQEISNASIELLQQETCLIDNVTETLSEAPADLCQKDIVLAPESSKPTEEELQQNLVEFEKAIDIEIKSEVIQPEYPVQSFAPTPSEESKIELISQNDEPIAQQNSIIVEAATAAAAALQPAVATETKPPAIKKSTAKLAATTPPARKLTSTKSSTTPSPALKTTSGLAKTSATKSTTATSRATPKTTTTPTSKSTTTVQQTLKASPRPKNLNTTALPKTTGEKKSDDANKIAAIKKTSSTSFTGAPRTIAATRNVPSKASPTKAAGDVSSRVGAASKLTNAAKTAGTTTKPFTTVSKTTSLTSTTKPFVARTSAASTTKSAAAKSASTLSPKVSSSNTSTTSKPMTRTVPAKPLTNRTAPKAADTEKQIKETANKQITAASRTASKTAPITKTSVTNIRRTEVKAPATRTITKTTSKTTTTVTNKKPAELIRHNVSKTTSKVTAIKAPATIETKNIINETEIIKDISPITENIICDNSQLQNSNSAD